MTDIFDELAGVATNQEKPKQAQPIPQAQARPVAPQAKPVQAQPVPQAQPASQAVAKKPEWTMITQTNVVNIKKETTSFFDKIKALFKKTPLGTTTEITTLQGEKVVDDKVSKTGKINLNYGAIYDNKKTQLLITLSIILIAGLIVGWYAVYFFNTKVYSNFTKLENAKLMKKEYNKQLAYAEANFEDLSKVLEDNQELVIITPESVQEDLIQRLYSVGNELGMDLKQGKNLVVNITDWQQDQEITIINIPTYTQVKKLIKEMWKWRNYYLLKGLEITLGTGETAKDYSYKLRMSLIPSKTIMFWNNNI